MTDLFHYIIDWFMDWWYETHIYGISCKHYPYPCPYLDYWRNIIINDEHLRGLGDSIFKARPPYRDFLCEIYNPDIWSDSTLNWYYRKFHVYGVFKRRVVAEIWSTGASLGPSYGLADLNYEDWNRIMPDFLNITWDDLVRCPWEEMPTPIATLDEVNIFLSKPGTGLMYENMTWWEKNIKFNYYLGGCFFRWKLWFMAKWKYRWFWWINMKINVKVWYKYEGFIYTEKYLKSWNYLLTEYLNKPIYEWNFKKSTEVYSVLEILITYTCLFLLLWLGTLLILNLIIGTLLYLIIIYIFAYYSVNIKKLTKNNKNLKKKSKRI